MNILLFGGTSEGRELAGWLAGEGHSLTLCVATDYGAALVPDIPGLAVHTGRLDREDMGRLLSQTVFDKVIDATHPYAVEVTQNLRAACGAAGIPYLRLVRRSEWEDGCRKAGDMAGAAYMLERMPGNVLLTTGSKELAPFAVPSLRERCFPRVLPTLDSLTRCLDLGFPPAHIICMQGPFSKELNAALIRQFDIKTLVTKDSGGYGGFRDKADAAGEAGCELLVVERPEEETGLDLEELKKRIQGERIAVLARGPARNDMEKEESR